MSAARVSVIALAAVALAFGCRSVEPPPPAVSLLGTSWVAEEIDGRPVDRIESTLSEQERRFLDGLAAASAFKLADGKLTLLDAGGRARMRLIPRAPR